MIASIMEIKTDKSLLESIEKVRGSRITTKEKFEQRVSFAYSTLSGSNSMSKEEVRDLLEVD